MRRALLCTALLAGLLTTAAAAPPGFITDLGQAEAHAASTGKLIFVYFNLPG
jgi:hypothetical protein